MPITGGRAREGRVRLSRVRAMQQRIIGAAHSPTRSHVTGSAALTRSAAVDGLEHEGHRGGGAGE
jgi:hypothetical protein